MPTNGQKEARKRAAGHKDMTTGILEKAGIAAAGKATPVARVVERCQKGDPDAFKELFERHVNGVHRHLLLLLGPDDDVDDLVQLVFLNVFQSIRKFRGSSAFSTWLFRITINVARQEIRGKMRRRRLGAVVKEVTEVQEGTSVRTPERDLSNLQQVYGYLDRLSSKKRETFILYTYEGYSLQEIAELLDSSVSTVGSRLQAARKEIMSFLVK